MTTATTSAAPRGAATPARLAERRLAPATGHAPAAGSERRDGTTRLLGAWQAHQSARLAEHLAHHGPPVLPPPRACGWADLLARLVADAGLTGRGGAGFPTSAKLAAAARAGGRRWLVVDGLEGEPESAKDRVLLQCAPHLVLDGAELVAAALGADRITVCVAADQGATATAVHRAATERERTALAPVPVELARPPARFLAGEESALVNWLRCGTALPTFRPDKAVPLAIGRRTMLVHNAETLAHVALVARHGAKWFRHAGTADAPGTTLVTVSGAVARPGVVEVELGTPIDTIVAAAKPTATVHAVLVGGRGGTWLGTNDMGTPLAPRALRERGAAVGAGILVALPAEACGVAEIARMATAMAAESAGQCGPCVFGLPAIADDLRRLAAAAAPSGPGSRSGIGADPDLGTRLQRRLGAVTGRGACRHPDGVVRMVRSGLAVFADDVARHGTGRPCTAATPVAGPARDAATRWQT